MKNIKLMVAIIGLILFTACGSNEEPKNKPETTQALSLTDQQMKFNSMTMGKLEMREFAPIINSYGKVEVPPQNKTVITAKFGGFVKRVLVLDGMFVKKGQTLIEIEDPSILQMQQDYLENQSNLEYLKGEYERQELLSKQEATSLKSFQQAKANYFSAKARHAGMKSKLQLAGVNVSRINENSIQTSVSLVAPFSGIVTKVNVQTGAYVQSQDQLLELIDTQHAHAELEVYEKDLANLAIGQDVELFFTNKKEAVLAKVYLIGHDISRNKTVLVHGHFLKEERTLIPGAFFRAKIKAKSSNYLSIPAKAVINNKGKNIIFVKTGKSGKNTNFKVIEVQILAQNEDFIAVKFDNMNNLKTSEFLIEGAYELFSKMQAE
jgi:RND family efflux transporter MFP subunit